LYSANFVAIGFCDEIWTFNQLYSSKNSIASQKRNKQKKRKKNSNAY